MRAPARLWPWRALLTIAVAFACTMAFLPEPPRVPGDPPDKFLHAIAFVVLAGLSRLSFPGAGFWHILLPLAALGLAIECVQSIPALGRDASALDWAADIVAAAVTLALLKPFARKPSRQNPARERLGGRQPYKPIFPRWGWKNLAISAV